MRRIGLALLFAAMTVVFMAEGAMAQVTTDATNTVASTSTTTTTNITASVVDGMIEGSNFADQGDCTKIPEPNDNLYSTRSCPGISGNMLVLQYPNRLPECVYINNATSTTSFFVPLRTATEWDDFKNPANRPAGVTLDYGCREKTETLCGGHYSVSLPNGHNQDPADILYGLNHHAIYRCDVQEGSTCGDWTPLSTPTCSTDAVCGLANGVSVASAPSSNLCTEGTASAVMGAGPFSWTCASTDGGTSASCSAPLASTCTPGVATPTDFVLLIDASGSMAQTITDAKAALNSVVANYLVAHPEVRMAVNVLGGTPSYTKIRGGTIAGYTGTLQSYYGNLYPMSSVNAAAVTAAVAPLSDAGNTPLAEAMTYSQTMLTAPGHRHVLLVLTDAKETAQTKIDPATVVTQLRDAGTIVYGVQYGVGTTSTSTRGLNSIVSRLSGLGGASNFNVATFFANMNAYSLATSQAAVLSAIDSIVNSSVLSCDAVGAKVDGVCGSSSGTSMNAAPTSDLCNSGTASAVAGNSPWTWSCTGANGGVNALCSSHLPIVNAVCGAADGTVTLTAPTTDLCSVGTATSLSGTWDWTCLGSGGGNNATCSASPPPVNAVCGSANGVMTASKPNSSLCASGNATPVSGLGPWSWTCSGLYGGTDAACSAPAALVDGVCGSANGVKADKNGPVGTLCNAGNASPTVKNGAKYTWTCQGIGGGSNASCTTK